MMQAGINYLTRMLGGSYRNKRAESLASELRSPRQSAAQTPKMPKPVAPPKKPAARGLT